MALQSAKELAKKYNWGQEKFKQAASFRLDNRVQHFVELEIGGAEAFTKMLQDKLYFPYSWYIRNFKEGETNES